MKLFPRSRDPSGFTLLDLMMVMAVFAVLVLGYSSLATASFPGGARICAVNSVGISDPLLTQQLAQNDIVVENTYDPLPRLDTYTRALDVLPCQVLAQASRHYLLIDLQTSQTPTYEFTTEVMVTGRHYTRKNGIKNMPPSGAIHLAQSDQYVVTIDGYRIFNV